MIVLLLGLTPWVHADEFIKRSKLFEAGRMLVVGGEPGSVEGPAFVGELVTRVLEEHLPVRLAIQWPPSGQAALEAYLASSGDAAARAALMQATPWMTPPADGSASRAMFDLVELLRSAQASGEPVSVWAFDSDAAGADRERQLATALLEDIAAHPEQFSLVFCANRHSNQRRMISRQERFAPMARHLKQKLANHLVSIDVAHTGGQAWRCVRAADQPTCGPTEIRGRGPLEGEWLELGESIERAGHNGWYHVGALTASPPAIQAAATDR